ncbi:hypothetical protein B0H11DRAFT_2234231 [Mycena galericulata]|nr:hypothetical protein B0H11DRAFT_2234231 [Mycena galericulata]
MPRTTPSEPPQVSSPNGPPFIPPQPPAGADDAYAAPTIERQSLHPDRISWIVPPSIRQDPQGRFSKWELSEYRGTRAWIRRGHKQKFHSKNIWFDRENERELIFGSYPLPPGVLDSPRFGAPVPRFAFMAPVNEGAVPNRASHWMYPQRRADRQDVARIPLPPLANQLPLLKLASKWPTDKEAASTAEDDDDDDDNDGHDAEDVKPSEVPSNVVLVEGYPNMSALKFHEKANEVLGSIMPLAIVVGGQRFWLSFPTTTDGLKAFGSLGKLHTSFPDIILSFAQYREFELAFQSSQDWWTSEGAFPPLPQSPSHASALPTGGRLAKTEESRLTEREQQNKRALNGIASGQQALNGVHRRNGSQKGNHDRDQVGAYCWEHTPRSVCGSGAAPGTISSIVAWDATPSGWRGAIDDDWDSPTQHDVAAAAPGTISSIVAWDATPSGWRGAIDDDWDSPTQHDVAAAAPGTISSIVAWDATPSGWRGAIDDDWDSPTQHDVAALSLCLPPDPHLPISTGVSPPARLEASAAPETLGRGRVQEQDQGEEQHCDTDVLPVPEMPLGCADADLGFDCGDQERLAKRAQKDAKQEVEKETEHEAAPEGERAQEMKGGGDWKLQQEWAEQEKTQETERERDREPETVETEVPNPDQTAKLTSFRQGVIEGDQEREPNLLHCVANSRMDLASAIFKSAPSSDSSLHSSLSPACPDPAGALATEIAAFQCDEQVEMLCPAIQVEWEEHPEQEGERDIATVPGRHAERECREEQRSEPFAVHPELPPVPTIRPPDANADLQLAEFQLHERDCLHLSCAPFISGSPLSTSALHPAQVLATEIRGLPTAAKVDIACQTEVVDPQVFVEKVMEVEVPVNVERMEAPVGEITPMDAVYIGTSILPLFDKDPGAGSAYFVLGSDLSQANSPVFFELLANRPSGQTISSSSTSNAPPTDSSKNPPSPPRDPSPHLPASNAATPPTAEPMVSPNVVTPPPPGMSSAVPEDPKKLRSEVIKGLEWGLKYATGNHKALLRYKDYERLVEAQYGWRLIGWPDGIAMQPPSRMGGGGTDALRLLWDRLKSGKCHWAKLSDPVHQALREKYQGYKRVKEEVAEEEEQPPTSLGKRKLTVSGEHELRPAKMRKTVQTRAGTKGTKRKVVADEEEECVRKKAKRGMSTLASTKGQAKMDSGNDLKDNQVTLGSAVSNGCYNWTGGPSSVEPKPQRSPKRLSLIDEEEDSSGSEADRDSI